MVSLAEPFWLLGLGLLPLLWWLHRFRDSGRRLTVSALFLWRRAAPADTAGRILARADPQWRLRAASILCLLVALTGPRWRSQRPPIVVWVDDSLSLFTQEEGRSRLATGIDSLLPALQASAAAAITVRSLGDPAKVLVLDREQPQRWRSALLAALDAPTAAPRLPAAVELDNRAEHWLVSDGARPDLQDWLRLAPVAHVIQVGRLRENVGLTTLAVRSSLTTATALQALVAIANLGEQPAQRELEIRIDDHVVWRQTAVLAPGQIVRLQRPLPMGKSVQAKLTPADALLLDDELRVTVPAPVTWRLAGDCGAPLHAALAAHPRLQQVEAEADLTIACAPLPPSVDGPLLLFHPSLNNRPVQGILYWHPAAGALRQLPLEADWLARVPAAPPAAATEALLTAGEIPLIVRAAHAGRLIDVLLAMDNPTWSDRPEYPWLLAGLIELAVQRELLGAIADVQRDPQASRIAPVPLQPREDAKTNAAPLDWQDSASVWIALCALLLLLDLWRQRRFLPP